MDAGTTAFAYTSATYSSMGPSFHSARRSPERRSHGDVATQPRPLVLRNGSGAPGSVPRRVLGRHHRVRPYAGASIHIGAERPAACERLLYLLAGRVRIEGVYGQLGLDLNDEWPLLLWHRP